MALLKLSLSFLALKISNLPIWPPIQFSIPCMAFPSVMFASNWPAPAPGSSKPQRPVLTALLRSFWPQFLLTAVLGVAHLSVMYIGPSLVDRFVEFVRCGGELTEGLQLVAALLVGKAAKTLALHHYEFQGQKLGKVREEGLRGNANPRVASSAQSYAKGGDFPSPERLEYIL